MSIGGRYSLYLILVYINVKNAVHITYDIKMEDISVSVVNPVLTIPMIIRITITDYIIEKHEKNPVIRVFILQQFLYLLQS